MRGPNDERVWGEDEPDEWDAGDRSCEPEWDRFDVDWDGDPDAIGYLFEDGEEPMAVDRRWARAR